MGRIWLESAIVAISVATTIFGAYDIGIKLLVVYFFVLYSVLFGSMVLESQLNTLADSIDRIHMAKNNLTEYNILIETVWLIYKWIKLLLLLLYRLLELVVVSVAHYSTTILVKYFGRRTPE